MNPQEAKAIALKAEYDEVLELIRIAAESGKFKIERRRMSDENADRLIKEGYKIHAENSRMGGRVLIISFQ